MMVPFCRDFQTL